MNNNVTFGDYMALHKDNMTSEVWDMGVRKRMKVFKGETAWSDAERCAYDWDIADRYDTTRKEES